MKSSFSKLAIQTLFGMILIGVGFFLGTLVMGTQCYQWDWQEIFSDAFNSEAAATNAVPTPEETPYVTYLANWPEFNIAPYTANCCEIGTSVSVGIYFPEGIEGLSFGGSILSNGLVIGTIGLEPASHPVQGWTYIGIPITGEITSQELTLIVTASHPDLGATELEPIVMTRSR